MSLSKRSIWSDFYGLHERRTALSHKLPPRFLVPSFTLSISFPFPLSIDVLFLFPHHLFRLILPPPPPSNPSRFFFLSLSPLSSSLTSLRTSGIICWSLSRSARHGQCLVTFVRLMKPSCHSTQDPPPLSVPTTRFSSTSPISLASKGDSLIRLD
ncbi:unnamed protein product [Acanthosepion pharaonis]|uniref:Uncharacterized protein n=1 Tax=Acanthosepion pharaonis TaxID=158019 RepID=A0A812AWI4_ACAPH|nr:unnamed protein product [Sepia pharaonis]